MKMAGRKADPIWAFYDKIPSTTPTGCRARCKSCKYELQGLVARLRTHQLKCSTSNSTEKEVEIVEPNATSECQSNNSVDLKLKVSV